MDGDSGELVERGEIRSVWLAERISWGVESPAARFMAPKNNSIRSVAFVSLGCPKNLVDSERMLGLLAQDGLSLTPDAANADAIIINTCGFLEASKDESMKEIRDAIDLKTSGKCQRVVVAGCLVQRHKTRL